MMTKWTFHNIQCAEIRKYRRPYFLRIVRDFNRFEMFIWPSFRQAMCSSFSRQKSCIIYIRIRYWVVLRVCSSAIKTTFPLSNFRTKHIFGNLVALRKFYDHLGRRSRPERGALNLGHLRRPKLFFSTVTPNGAPRRPNFFSRDHFGRRRAPPEGKGNTAEGGCFSSTTIKS